MGIFLAVLKDLYTFAVRYHFGFRDTMPQSGPPASDLVEHEGKENERNQQMPLLDDIPSVGLLPEAAEDPVVESTEELSFESVGYALSPDTCLYALPTRSFDGVIKRLPYGASFRILNTQGKWCNVLYNDIRGWIHRDDLTESNAVLSPQFSAGAFYGPEDPETVKLRTLIDDEFHAGSLALPLQDVEFVSYKLKRRGRTIDWPNARPRIAGTWQKLLKGVPGVHIGVSPKTGAVMEYVNEDNTGHVTYVDSVYPDGAITISEIGYPEEGKYCERTLNRHEWKELRPVFIEVS